MYVSGKMRPVGTIPGEKEKSKMIEEVISTMINCKKFCKCTIIIKVKYKQIKLN
jgi:hypothetical protein